MTGKVPGSPLTSGEWNQLAQEIQNIITSSGQTLTNSQLTQAVRSIASYAAISDFYLDSGAANAYVLGPIGSLYSPVSYENGMRVRFYTANSSNNATVTVNVNGLGSRNVVTEDGSSMAVNGISSTHLNELVYDGPNSRFKLRIIPQNAMASESQAGIAELATIAEINLGDNSRILTSGRLMEARGFYSQLINTAADTSRASDTTRTADPYLDQAILVPANSSVSLEGYLLWHQPNLGGINFSIGNTGLNTEIHPRYTLGVDANSNFLLGASFNSGAGSQAVFNKTTASFPTSQSGMTITGHVTNTTGSPVAIRFLWAQNTSNATALSLFAGSWLRAQLLPNPIT